MTKCNSGTCDVGVISESWGAPVTIYECDLRREGSDVLRFILAFRHCPTCGHKIEWDRIENELEDYFKKVEVKDDKLTWDEFDKIERDLEEKLCKKHKVSIATCDRRCIYSGIRVSEGLKNYEQIKGKYEFVCAPFRKDMKYFLENISYGKHVDGKKKGILSWEAKMIGIKEKKYKVEGQLMDCRTYTDTCKYFKCYKCNVDKYRDRWLVYL